MLTGTGPRDPSGSTRGTQRRFDFSGRWILTSACSPLISVSTQPQRSCRLWRLGPRHVPSATRRHRDLLGTVPVKQRPPEAGRLLSTGPSRDLGAAIARQRRSCSGHRADAEDETAGSMKSELGRRARTQGEKVLLSAAQAADGRLRPLRRPSGKPPPSAALRRVTRCPPLGSEPWPLGSRRAGCRQSSVGLSGVGVRRQRPAWAVMRPDLTAAASCW